MYVEAKEQFRKARGKVKFYFKSVKSETPGGVSLVKFSVTISWSKHRNNSSVAPSLSHPM